MGGIVGEAERKHTHMSSAAENVEEWCHKVQLSERASHVCVSVCVCERVKQMKIKSQKENKTYEELRLQSKRLELN